MFFAAMGPTERCFTTCQGQGSKRISDWGIMADCRCVQVFMFCVFTQIFLRCLAQNTNMQNVAVNKPCGISTMYNNANKCSAALNGNTNTDYQENPPNCIHTAEDDTSPFWWVDLGEKVTINMITIYGRTKYIHRMRCVNVSVDGALVKRFTDVSDWTNDKYTITVFRGGQVVKVTKDCDNDGPTINICEVQVWECADGWYGINCSQTCGNCITSSDCNKTTGQCTSCKTGFSLPNCTDCDKGWYGHNCNETCGHCMGGNSTCDKINGSCSSCDGAFQPPLCKDHCEKGWYGHNCVETCGHCMGGNSNCDKTNGSCLSCDGAFKPPLCKDNCEDGWYGNNCAETCGHCMGGNSACDNINGSCPSCDGAFKPPLCKVNCENGWYGRNCVETCGHCMGGNSACDKINGSCLSCDGAFTPPLCKDNCDKGWYGHNCAETCGHCMGGNSTCDRINGSCPSCDGAFTPPLCKDNLSSKFPMTTSNTSSSIQAGMSRDNDKETVSVAGPVAGAAVGCAVVFFIVGAVFSWWLRKSRSQQPSATGSSPYEIPIISDSGTARPTSRPNEKVDTTPDYTNIGYTTNVYDSLKAPDDSNTAAYTSLDFHTQSDVHR